MRELSQRRPRILIVNCHFDELRWPIKRKRMIPQAMGPIYLAGVLSRDRCDVRVYSEVPSGPMAQFDLLEWADLLVLTGLTNSLDRMRQLTAYARTLNPKVVVVVGGPVARVFPAITRQFSDFTCIGDVEELGAVAAEVFGDPSVAADEPVPRFDLAYWLRDIGYMETSRYCNFSCSFCALTGEGRKYHPYPVSVLRKHISALGRRKFVVLIDNNFYGPNRRDFLERVEFMHESRDQGHFKGWSALVTSDFFRDGRNLELVREAGCTFLFCGVESFDDEWLKSVNKPQNVLNDQVENIERCLDAGVLFLYGLVADLSSRNIEAIRGELEFVFQTPRITVPSFVTISIPIPGTPYFQECLERELILPNTRVRDLDSSTIVMRPVDDLDLTATFIHELQVMKGMRSQVFRHFLRFRRRYSDALSKHQMLMYMVNCMTICQPALNGFRTLVEWKRNRRLRTYVSSTERLDSTYTPALPLSEDYRDYFKPTMLTDEHGQLAMEVAEDLARGHESATPGAKSGPATHVLSGT